MEWLDIELIRHIFGEPIAQQFMTWTCALGLASFIHSGRVKKEIAAQGDAVTGAINNLGQALRQDLKNQSERIEKVETGLKNVTDRVLKLEDPLG